MKFEEYQAAVESINFGKKLPTATYMHRSMLAQLPDVLGCYLARVLKASKIPDAAFNIVKLSRTDFRVSLLNYPAFDVHPYPELLQSFTLDLEKKSLRKASYKDSINPPILHRRELFVAHDHPDRAAYIEFTREGDAIGAYENSRGIGTRQGWIAALRRLGYRIGNDGHLERLQLTSDHVEVLHERAIERHKTALSRTELSVPMFTLARAGFINKELSVLDYGCGKGDDLKALCDEGIDCAGWDPVYLPDEEPSAADVVNLGYVINVIEDREERKEVLEKAYALTRRLLCVSAMLGNEAILERFKPYRDGVMTKRGTFQKYYFQSELREFIESTLGVDAIAAGPGLFFVFSDNQMQQQYLANRHRTAIDARELKRRATRRKASSISAERLAENKSLLDDLWATVLELGRPPSRGEFDQAEACESIFGSLRKAFNACEQLYGSAQFEKAENVRKNDLLVYLALEHFSKRKPYSRMPASLRRDINYHFGKYTDARSMAQASLFSVSDVDVINKACSAAHNRLPASFLEPEVGLTFHKSFINQCPPILRIYVGCALQLYGDLVSIDLIKVHIQSGKVTLLGYDDFEGEPIPRLQERIKVKMAEQDIDFFDYVLGFKPPPLLCKSRYIDPSSPSYLDQVEFDKKLREMVGQDIDEPNVSEDRFRALLRDKKVRIRGSEILRR
nr:hypothetical protein 3 [Halieaceae bacterium]